MPSSKDLGGNQGDGVGDRGAAALARRGSVDLQTRPRDPHHVLKAWIALILWLIVISIESTAYLSSEHTSRILYPLFHFLFGIDQVRFEPWHFFLRKCGHVFGYGLLSILLFRAWRETLPAASGARWTFRWATIAVFGTAVVASLDEWHQSYIPTRTGTVHDVILDTCAGIAAQLAVILWLRWF
jgi:VanZ family protein